jgi:hypothetical protein
MATLRYLKEPFRGLQRRALQRFFLRFHAYIPSTRHKTLSAIIRLPPSLGGLGLVLNPQTEDFEHLPDIIWWAIGQILKQTKLSFRIKQHLSSVFTNRYSGFKNPLTVSWIKQAEEDCSTLCESYSDVKERLDFKGRWSEFLDEAQKQGYLRFFDFLRLLERPFRFSELLSGRIPSQFNTLSNRERVRRLWNKLEEFYSIAEDKSLPEKVYKTISDSARMAETGYLLKAPRKGIFDEVGSPDLRLKGRLIVLQRRAPLKT